MCQPASFIITPSRVLWLPKSDSHSDILKKYGIRDDYDKPDFVKVEIVPPNEDYRQPIEKWVYSVDSDQKYFPEWYNDEEAEKACREELKHWYAEKVIKSGKHTFSGLVNKIILGGNVTINDLGLGSKIWVYDKSKFEVNNMKCGDVWFHDNSTGTINNQIGGKTNFSDNSTGEVNKVYGGNVEFFDNSTGTLNNQSGGKVWFWDDSSGKLNNQTGGVGWFYDNSTGKINNHSGGNVKFYDNSTGTLNNQTGGEVKFFDASKQLNN